MLTLPPHWRRDSRLVTLEIMFLREALSYQNQVVKEENFHHFMSAGATEKSLQSLKAVINYN